MTDTTGTDTTAAGTGAGRTALVLVDLQRWIVDLPWEPRDGAAVLAASAALRAGLARLGPDPVLVLVRHLRADGADGGPDAPANLLCPPVTPAPGDLVITKDALDAFAGTGLGEELARLAVTDVVLAGLATTHGIAATARTAAARGLRVTVVRDAVAARTTAEHDGALAELAALGVLTATVGELLAGVAPAA
ncbi:cysteine hydrolase family protein [Streptomyces sp. BI20]|uniref:cysteine hydrolase family protein n=1 Tax=Streptomyces sp. BI20 TaxID=3403460 RepID=UPI003C75E81D